MSKFIVIIRMLFQFYRKVAENKICMKFQKTFGHFVTKIACLFSEWIPRENNFVADEFSRMYDNHDWSIQTWGFSVLDKVWGPYTMDRFSSNNNAHCKRFNCRWWCPGCAAVDDFW
jgi:hypothetical protein